MKAEDITKYLKNYRIQSRWTTFNAAFQSALAVPDEYDVGRVSELVQILGQDPSEDLSCVYCGSPAATWDHLYNNVKDGRFSGYGHRIFNLVPACRTCNERKGAKNWRQFIEIISPSDKDVRIERLERVDQKNTEERIGWSEIKELAPDLAEQYAGLIDGVREQLKLADSLAAEIRAKIKERRL